MSSGQKFTKDNVMKKIILPATFAFALAACGDSVGDQAQRNGVREAIDEKALVAAVNSSIDRNTVEGMAHGAIAGAVQEAIPAEARAVAAVVDEKALAKGIDQAIDGKALGTAAEDAIKGVEDRAQR